MASERASHGYKSKRPKKELARTERILLHSSTTMSPGIVRGITRQIAGGLLILIALSLIAIVVCTIVY